MITIGETFGNELVAAGCNLGVSFTVGGTDADICYMDHADRAAVQAVIAAHDSTLKLSHPPDRIGFSNAIKSALGGIVQANTLAASYPLLSPAIDGAVWSDAQALIIDAKANAVITTTQYSAIKTAASTFNIPVEL